MQPLEGKLTLSSDTEEISRVERIVMEAVHRHAFHEQDRFAIKLALEEALANAIRHGNGCDRSKRIRVEFHVGPDVVKITIEDEGCGFDPGHLADPTLDENLEKPNGRGVMLMRVYMDEVCFDGPGNRVTMLKRRTPYPRNEGTGVA